VLLSRHGAFVGSGYDDCEGELLALVRDIVGPEVPLGVELDPHANLGAAMLASATALVCFKEYPHVDFVARASELFTIVDDAANRRTRPRLAAFDCRMIGGYHTTAEPMRSYVDRLHEHEREPGVLSISVFHSFPWGDVPHAGTKLLVITDELSAAPGRGEQLAESLGRELYALRGRTFRPQLSLGEGLDRALAAVRGPVVIGDVSDNPSGGAPGDSTFVLAELLRRGAPDVALATIYDPVAVQIAMSVGEGASLDLRIGGKLGPMSGAPLDLRVTVRRVVRGMVQRWGTATNPLGDVAVVLTGGVDIVLADLRAQVVDPEVFRALGLEPEQRRVLVVKSSQHYRAAFTPIAAEVLDIAAPGAIEPNFAALPLRRIQRPKWPFDADPWA
jgi:microcystin degradation protein MlrC